MVFVIVYKRMNTRVVEKGCKIWLVVRSVSMKFSNLGFKLIKGDTIKLGRIKLVVREIILDGIQEKPLE